jgi:hypothetical protein
VVSEEYDEDDRDIQTNNSLVARREGGLLWLGEFELNRALVIPLDDE